MIVHSNCYLDLTIGGKDVSSPGSNVFVTISEYAMNLPELQIQLSGSLIDTQYLSSENTEIKMRHGHNASSAVDTLWTVVSSSVDGNYITLTARPSKLLEFYRSSNVYALNGSSIDCLKNILGKFGKVQTDLTSTDSMNWICHNLTDLEFSREIWRHSYVSDKSLLLYAIDATCSSRIVDAFDLSRKSVKVVVMRDRSNDDEVVSLTPITVSNWSSINDESIGQIGNNVVDLKSGKVDISVPSYKSIFGKSNLLKVVSKNRQRQNVLNDNVHEKFYEAEIKNLTNANRLGNFNSVFQARGSVNLLDLVNIESTDGAQLVDYSSGRALVVGRKWLISHAQADLEIRLLRDAITLPEAKR